MRARAAGRLVLLILPLGLGACSWLPWHHRHHAVDDAPLAASTSAAAPAAPASAAPTAAASSAMPAENVAPASSGSVDMADRSDSTRLTASMIAPIKPSVGTTPAAPPVAAPGRYAPLDEAEWRELFADYEQLAQCEDRYMNSAGLNSRAVAERLVVMNRAGALRVDAMRLLDRDAPVRRQWSASDAGKPEVQVGLVEQTLMALMRQDGRQTSLGRTLARKAVARYHVAEVTGTVCPVGARYQTLMHKAAS